MYCDSALGLKRILGLGSYRTVWAWLYKLRRAMVRPGRDRLLGEVEADETYIGCEKPGKRGRGAAGKALVLVAVEDKVIGIGVFALDMCRMLLLVASCSLCKTMLNQ